MRNLWVAVLILLSLGLSACTKPTPTPPTSAPPAAPATIPLPKLERDQIGLIELLAPRSGQPSVQLYPADNPAMVDALLAAIAASPPGRIAEPNASARLTAVIRQKQGESLLLSLPTSDGHVQANWRGQPLLIDAPALSKALAALEPELAKAPKPGTTIWAVDLSGKQAPEVILEHDTPLAFGDASPDGRYLLLVRQMGEYKGDYRAIPFLLDRQTGTLNQGEQTSIRFTKWSGRGFYLDWLSHLGLDLRAARLDRVAATLPKDFDLVATAYTSDGQRFAALVGKRGPETKLDLITGNTDGTQVVTQTGAITGWDTQMGLIAHLAWSPDDKWLVLNGQSGGFLAAAADLRPATWTRLADGGLGVAPVWAPDSRHVWFSTGAIFDLQGKEVARPKNPAFFVWRPDGQAGVVSWYTGQELLAVNGNTTDLKLPAGAIPGAFLPDGRLLVWRTIYSR